MTSRNLLNLVLLAVVAALIALVVFEPGIEPEANNPVLTTLKQDDIHHIYIKRDTDEDVELVKTNNVWQMLKPYPVAAHKFRVQTILRLVEAESHSQHQLAKLNKVTFGLDKPKATVTFNKQYKILFGTNEPLQQHRYVQVDNTLHTITDSFYYQVASKVSTFIDHSLLAADSVITKLELKDIVVELKEGKWQVTPQPEYFSADAVTELLNSWRNTQAIEIDKAGPSKSKQSFNIYIKDVPQPVKFNVVSNENGIALVRNDIGLAYSVSKDSFEKLSRLPVISPAETSAD